jgi:hypothetical protein
MVAQLYADDIATFDYDFWLEPIEEYGMPKVRIPTTGWFNIPNVQEGRWPWSARCAASK